MCRRLASLEELSAGPIPPLQEVSVTLDENFVRAADMAEELETRLKDFMVSADIQRPQSYGRIVLKYI